MEDLLNLATRQMRLHYLDIRRANEAAEPDSAMPVIQVGSRVQSIGPINEVEPLETRQVQDASGQADLLRYQFARPAGLHVLQEWDEQDADSLERQDVEACLPTCSVSSASTPANRPT